MGFSFDAIGSKVNDAVSAAPLSAAQAAALNANGALPQGLGLCPGRSPTTPPLCSLPNTQSGPVKLFAGYEHMNFATRITRWRRRFPSRADTPSVLLTNTNFTTDRILQVFWAGARYSVRPDLDLTLALLPPKSEQLYYWEWDQSNRYLHDRCLFGLQRIAGCGFLRRRLSVCEALRRLRWHHVVASAERSRQRLPSRWTNWKQSIRDRSDRGAALPV